jgi:hypothetical protein
MVHSKRSSSLVLLLVSMFLVALLCLVNAAPAVAYPNCLPSPTNPGCGPLCFGLSGCSNGMLIGTHSCSCTCSGDCPPPPPSSQTTLEAESSGGGNTDCVYTCQ